MSTRPLIAKYPLDKSGRSPTNKVVGEIREINQTRERAFVPFAGPFYADETFVITNVATGKPLKPVDDYILCQPFQQASLRTGKDVECVVWIKTPVPITVRIDYQVVGGEYSWNIDALLELIAEINLDNRPVAWGSVLGKPTAYPPAPHIHDIGDTYGWEYVVYQLEAIRNAILVGDEASHDELRAQMRSMRAELEALIAGLDDRLTAHVNDKSNPHETTKAQVGLGDVENFPIASEAEATIGTAQNRYMTPARTTLLIDRLVKEAMDAHIADKSNPHDTTKDQVGLGSVANYAPASAPEAVAGVVSDKYMTPSVTRAAIMAQVGDAFYTHVANKENPHETSKAQVGLGLVDNFATATVDEARAGQVGNKFMTAALTNAAIRAQVADSYFLHEANKENPHQTTKTQVGLGNLPNAITRDRQTDSSVTLLLAGAMYDHILAGDHDNRYVMINSNMSASLREVNGTLQGFVGGVWRQIWPAQWS